MFNQSNYSETYDREKLRILQTLNVQIQSMAIKLDQIVTQAEENIFKIKPTKNNNFRESLQAINNSLENKPVIITSNEKLSNIPIDGSNIDQNIMNNINSNNNANEIKLANNQQIVKIVDQPLIQATSKLRKSLPKSSINRKKKSIASLTKQEQNEFIKQDQGAPELNLSVVVANKPKQESHSINKRNKQQRIFNTFVRESINQLLGPDFMRTHDVQDIDAQVMEMIRKEAVENYLPENIRPRRAWHLAKASLRTLKRTLNNRKPK